jgi:hypothetical protein
MKNKKTSKSYFKIFMNYLYTIVMHRKIIKHLKFEAKHWKDEALKNFELRLTEFKADLKGMNATFEHPLIISLIDALVKTYKSVDGAKNYVSITYKGDDEFWEVTIRRKTGKTPSDLVAELKKENEELKEKLKNKI